MNRFFIILIFFSSTVFADITQVRGEVTDIYLFTKNLAKYDVNDVGLAAIYINSPDLLPGCGSSGSKRVIISTDHPLYQSVISLALTAKTTGKKVEIWHLNTCTQRYNSWDFSLIRFVE